MEIRIHPVPLVIKDPWHHLKTFFTLDGSRKYDAYIGSAKSPRNRITDDDVTAINTSMSARSPHGDWQPLIASGALPELAEVSPEWDLFTMPSEDWSRLRVPERLEALFTSVMGPGIGISRATKVLHIKRPALIPVCDAYVLRLLGVPGDGAASGVAATVHLRDQGRRNLEALRGLRDRLENELGLSRTLVRVADALIWGSYPDTWLAKREATTPPGAPGTG
jgi:Family of unknown function (DUF6308)